jgi:hypothetical protein
MPAADLAQTGFLWILEHYSIRAAREEDHINIPAAEMMGIQYKSGFVLRLGT